MFPPFTVILHPDILYRNKMSFAHVSSALKTPPFQKKEGFFVCLFLSVKCQNFEFISRIPSSFFFLFLSFRLISTLLPRKDHAEKFVTHTISLIIYSLAIPVSV